jgi:hypothetical protein
MVRSFRYYTHGSRRKERAGAEKAKTGLAGQWNLSGFSSAARLRRYFPASLLVGVLAGLLAICRGLAPIAAASELVQPFYSRNLNPFVQIYGLPAAEGAALVPAGRLEARLVFDAANNYAASGTQGEINVIRGETYRAVLAMRYGLREDLEIGIDLPYLYHGRGNLNDFIREWHDTFGLPQGGRSEATDAKLAYLYTDSGSELVHVVGSASGLGDVFLGAAMPLWESDGENPRRLTLRAAIKVPTGSASELQGSGSTDFSLRLSGEDRQTFAVARIVCFGSLGALLLSQGDVIPERQRHAVGFGTVGFGWQPLAHLALKLQFDGHTAFYNSAIDQLGDFSVQLLMGGTLGIPGDLLLDLAVSEDLIVGTAPDVVFHFGLRRLF